MLFVVDWIAAGILVRHFVHRVIVGAVFLRGKLFLDRSVGRRHHRRMALHPTEAARRLLRQAGQAAQDAKAPACEMLVDIGKRELAQGTPDGAVNAAFVAGRAFACAAGATMRGAFAGARRRGRR